MKRILAILILAGLVITGINYLPAACSQTVPVAQGDRILSDAFKNHRSGVQVSGEGTVVKVLADDTKGDRHQRFILKLASGQTLLIAHNIDIAPRIDSLTVGDTIAFYGVYEWNEKGGVIHWTHHDPNGHHVAGWLKKGEKTYQ